MWVLIIVTVMTIHDLPPTIDVSSVEFVTSEACEAARSKVQASANRLSTLHITASCSPTGKE